MNFIKKNQIEIIFYFLFCIGIISISFFHEPRFDEFEAWGISKDRLKNILFFIPHYECHMPLWFLILKCFSFFNINPEAGIKIPNIIFMIGCVYFLIFKSPFHKIIKFSLPFTFYIFYQYSIINRPYSIFCFSIFWLASLYKDRNKHPFLFALAIILLSESCLYGLAIATGIVYVWLIEIIRNKGFNVRTFINTKDFYIILFLLLTNIFILLGIFPNDYSDKSFSALFTNAEYITYKNYFLSFLYSLTGMFAEITFLNNFNLIIESIYLCDTREFFNFFNMHSHTLFINSVKFISICISGLFVHIFLIYKFKKHNVIILYLIPYCLVLILFTLYFMPHHIGLLYIFIIFVYWCGIDKTNINENKTLKFLSYILFFSCISIQLYWSYISSYNEILYQTSPAKQIATYIKKNNLEKYKIMGSWLNFTVYKNIKTNKLKFGEPGILYSNNTNLYKKSSYKDLNQPILATVITQYFNKNIFYNLNPDNQERQYILFKCTSSKENKRLKHLIKAKGTPDIIIGEVELQEIFDNEELINTEYTLAKSFYSYSLKKYSFAENKFNLYIKTDLYNQLILQD